MEGWKEGKKEATKEETQKKLKKRRNTVIEERRERNGEGKQIKKGKIVEKKGK